MALIQKYLIEVFVALGGTIAVILIILRFVKARAEKYIDTFIETKAKEKLAKFESDLEKRKMYFEASVSMENTLCKRIIEFYSKVTPIIQVDFSLFQEMYDRNLVFSHGKDIIINNDKLKELIKTEKDFYVQDKVYLDSSINKTHQDILQFINTYVEGIASIKDIYDVPADEKESFINSLKKIQLEIDNNLSNLKKYIERKS